MPRLRVLQALAVLLALAAPAEAIELRIRKERLRLDITETLVTGYHGDLGYLVSQRERLGGKLIELPERRFFDLISRLNASLQWRRFRLSTRFDTAVYFDTPPMSCAPGAAATLKSRFCQNYFYPEKLSLEYAGRELEVTLGDFYVSFGRGLVLSLRKLDELGIDTTLLGGRVVYHRGDAAAVLVAGVSNIQNVDQATGRSAADPYDVIAGARAEYRFLDKVIVGIHEAGGVVRKNATSLEQLRPDGMFMYGGSIDARRLTRWLSLYFEGAGQLAVKGDQRSTGYALYGSALALMGKAALLLEVKHYAKFQRWRSSVDGSLAEFANVAYNQPPTAERILTELTAPVYDVTGARLRLDWTLRREVLVFASYGFFEDRGVSEGLHYHDPYGGLELRWNEGRSHLFPSGGVRLERCGPEAVTCSRMNPSGEFQTIGHVEWDFTQLLPKRLSLEAQGFALFRRGDNQFNADGTPVSWTEGNAYVAFKWTPHLVFTVGYEWSTRPSAKLNEHFVNGAVQWNFTTASSLRVFAGGTRGGLRCISGVCRDFPPFTGALLELVVRL